VGVRLTGGLVEGGGRDAQPGWVDVAAVEDLGDLVLVGEGTDRGEEGSAEAPDHVAEPVRFLTIDDMSWNSQ
jgi:hypothetical protein